MSPPLYSYFVLHRQKESYGNHFRSSYRGGAPVAPAKRTPSPIDQVWNFFISVKLAIFTLIILAIASIFGTIVEQNQPPEKYHQIYEDWAFALMNRINLFDMYHPGGFWPSWSFSR